MKRILIILTAVTVFMSVEARAQFFGSGESGQTTTQSPIAAIQAQVLNQIYTNMATPGTPENAALVAAMTPAVTNALTAKPAPSAAQQYNELISNIVGNYTMTNAGTNPVALAAQKSMLEGTFRTMATQAANQNALELKKESIAAACDPNTNMMAYANPTCMGTQMTRYTQQEAAQKAAEDAAIDGTFTTFFSNFQTGI